MEKTSISDRLGSLIRTQGMSQKDFSAKTGVDKAIICRILKGECQPSADTIIRIAKATNVTTDWLLGLKD